ncbi:tetratricopeptide repeat protein [Aliikangiella marina]|uniref:Tetratricopeptide repeat protein n=1 Tax=Aliikangiella marina TaxID=1712262 RepID=A0A545T134_9GAMM|nr:tetratricopeptide repeat protein [Aliikangiella marina]TQV70922.1 tetratricopeptide repeat protein [Aliikangiella marina]
MNHSSVEKLLISAWKYRREGDYQTAGTLVDQAIQLSSEDDYANRGRAFHILAQFEADQNEFKNALNYYQQSQAFYEKTELQDKVAHSIRHVADTFYSLNEIEKARAQYESAIKMYNTQADTNDVDIANTLKGYALVLEKQNENEAAKKKWSTILSIYEKYNIQSGINEAKGKIEQLQE